MVREPRVDPEVELAGGHRHIGVGRRQLQISRIAHLITELPEQRRIDSSLHIAGRPVSPRHRHRNPGARSHGGFFQRHLGLFCSHLGLFCGLLSLFHLHLGCFRGLLGLLQCHLGLFAARFGRSFGLFERSLGRRQLGFGFIESGLGCRSRFLSSLLGGGVDHGDGRLGLSRRRRFIVAACHRQQCERRQQCQDLPFSSHFGPPLPLPFQFSDSVQIRVGSP